MRFAHYHTKPSQCCFVLFERGLCKSRAIFHSCGLLHKTGLRAQLLQTLYAKHKMPQMLCFYWNCYLESVVLSLTLSQVCMCWQSSQKQVCDKQEMTLLHIVHSPQSQTLEDVRLIVHLSSLSQLFFITLYLSVDN